MNANIPNEETQADTNVKKVSKLRIAAGVGLATIGLSIAGSLMPAVASADPYVPWSGPLHPFRHYAADVIHPVGPDTSASRPGSVTRQLLPRFRVTSPSPGAGLMR